MTKAEQIIERIGTSNSHCCTGRCNCKPYKPILIGDVILAIAQDYKDSEFKNERGLESHIFQYSQVPELCGLWAACGWGKSLQEIAETGKCESCNGDGFIKGHDPYDTRPEHLNYGDCQSCPVLEQCGTCKALGEVITPQASALIEFIHSIFITE